MTARIVLFGATGYTGGLVAAELVRRGARPVLAGRDAAALTERATALGGGLTTAVADAGDRSSIAALLERGDVLVSTVGPFMRFGTAAVEACIDRGAVYIDSTGEPPFIRRVFEDWSGPAERAGTTLLTAFGYDFVPGNVAAVVACGAAGDVARGVDVGYFVTGAVSASSMSAGTRASLAGVATQPAFAYRDGAVVTQRGAAQVHSFDVDGRQRSAVSIGASEHFGVPREVLALREVNVYLGWFGSMSRAVQVAAAAGELLHRAPGGERALDAVLERLPKATPRSGPDAAERARTRSHIVAIAHDERGHAVGAARMTGANSYDFTARIMAWAAERAAAGELCGRGALGPVAAFGLDGLRTACATAGLAVVEEAVGEGAVQPD